MAIGALTVRVNADVNRGNRALRQVGSAVRLIGTTAVDAAANVQVLSKAMNRLGGTRGVASLAGKAIKGVGVGLAAIGGPSGAKAGRSLLTIGTRLAKIASYVVPGGLIAKVLFGVAAVGGGVALARSLGQARDEFDSMVARFDRLNKVGEKLGIATQSLAGLRHAAKATAGMLSGTFDTALQRQVRRVAEAAQGTGEARAAIAELGLSAQHLATLSPDRQFMRIADAMAAIPNQGDRVRLAMKLFDTEGVALATTLGKGSAAIKSLVEEARALGATPMQRAADAASRHADQVERARLAWRGVGDELGQYTLGVRTLLSYIDEMKARFALTALRDGAGPLGVATDLLSSGGFMQVIGRPLGNQLAAYLKTRPNDRIGELSKQESRDSLRRVLDDLKAQRSERSQAEQTAADQSRQNDFARGAKAFRQYGEIGKGARAFGRMLASLSNRAAGAMASGRGPQLAAGPMGVNSLIDANSREGFLALRANQRDSRNGGAEAAKATAKHTKATADQSKATADGVRQLFDFFRKAPPPARA